MPKAGFPPYIFDSRSGELSGGNDGVVVLRHKVALLLAYLIEHRARLVTKEELLDNLWQHGDYRERSLTQSIRELRKVLGDNASNPIYIRTYAQRGYQWVASTEWIAPKENEVLANASVASSRSWKRPFLLATVVLGLLLVAGMWFVRSNAEFEGEGEIPSLLVLPFTNDTGDPALDWLQLGYADMLARSLAKSGLVRVTPPATATALLVGKGLDWPTLPVYLQGLLRDQQISRALVARVRLHKDQQVFDFQLLDVTGHTLQGAITYPALTDATDAVARQLLHLIAPGDPNNALPLAIDGDSPSAALARRVLAEGISAIQTEGPARADELFQAADLLVRQEPWVNACRAKTLLLTGKWSEAAARFDVLAETVHNTEGPTAFIAYWSAQLAYRRGDDEQTLAQLAIAIAAAEKSHDVETLIDSYRLRAEMAWQAMRWSEYNEWQAKADAILPRRADLRLEAERLFYLGKPVSQGLEKFPEENLQQSADYLRRALNFYTELGNRPMMAASELALARNEQLPLAERTEALNRALALYEALQQPYELAEALIYATFFYLQRHQGEQATAAVERAMAITATLGENRLTETLAFYHAFALLDRGLDQSHRELHNRNPQLLQQAITAFEIFLANNPAPTTRNYALVLLGWAYADSGAWEKALPLHTQAMSESRALGMDATFGYAVYAKMQIFLAQGDYAQVIELGREPVTTRQQLAYLARAHYELGQFEQAQTAMEKLRTQFPEQWSAIDDARYRAYQQAGATGKPIMLDAELPAHAIYCESDWQVGLAL